MQKPVNSRMQRHPSGAMIASSGLLASPRDRQLTIFEKKFLLCVERGDNVSVRK
jgi:hypothetical protein